MDELSKLYKKHRNCCIKPSGLSNRQKLERNEVKRGKRVTTKKSHRKWQLQNHLLLRQIPMKIWSPLRKTMTMSKRCNWCGQRVALLPGKPYCKNCCKSAYRICPRCHRCFNHQIFFRKCATRCNACQRKYIKERLNRRLSTATGKIKKSCIEGNISAGKSTLISHLKTHFSHRSDIVFVTEPVKEFMTFQDLFEPFRCQEREPYRDYVATQIHITNVLVDHYNKVFASLTDNISLLICDRYVHAVPVFPNALQHIGYISNFSHAVLLAYAKRLLLDVLPQADFIYYLDPQLSTIKERIEWRGRDGECGFVTLQYLETLSDEYPKQLLTDDYVWKRNKSTDAVDIILKDFIIFINENMSY